MSVNPAIQQIAREIDMAALRAMFRHMARRRSSLLRFFIWRIPQTAFVVALSAALVWWVVT